MTARHLAKRYSYLWTGELVAALLFAGLLIYYAAQERNWVNWLLRGYSVLIVDIILVQGSYYWWRKLQALKVGDTRLPPTIESWYKRFKVLNWALIASWGLVWLIKGAITGRWQDDDSGWGLLFLAGAVLEQINYHYVQLMYDNRNDLDYLMRHKRLKQGILARTLK